MKYSTKLKLLLLWCGDFGKVTERVKKKIKKKRKEQFKVQKQCFMKMRGEWVINELDTLEPLQIYSTRMHFKRPFIISSSSMCVCSFEN